MAADVEIQASRVISPAQRQEAASRAEAIRQGIGDLARLAQEAWRSRDWEALGYPDWAAYSAAEFGPDRIGARKAVAELLSGEGLSDAAIARETGVPRATVQRDLGRGGAHSVGTPSDQANVTKPVTRNSRAKSTAERVAEHRQRKRQEPPSAPEPTPPAADPAPRPAPPGDELQRLREQARDEAKAELRAKFEQRWNDLVRQRDELREQVRRLEAENLQLRRELGQADEDDEAGQRDGWELE